LSPRHITNHDYTRHHRRHGYHAISYPHQQCAQNHGNHRRGESVVVVVMIWDGNNVGSVGDGSGTGSDYGGGGGGGGNDRGLDPPIQFPTFVYLTSAANTITTTTISTIGITYHRYH